VQLASTWVRFTGLAPTGRDTTSDPGYVLIDLHAGIEHGLNDVG